MADFNSNVKKYMESWIDALEKLTDDEKDWIPDREELLAALRKLQRITEEQYKKKNVAKQLDDESYRKLADAYKEAGIQCEKYFENLPHQEQEDTEKVTKLFKEISAGLAQDMNSLQQYEYIKGKEAVSFQALIERGHVPVIDLGNAKTTSLGAAMSSRKAFCYKRLDGRDINGVFTEKTYFDPKKMAEEGWARSEENYKKLRSLFEDFYQAYLLGAKRTDSIESRKAFFTRYASAENPAVAATRKEEIVCLLKNLYGQEPKNEEKLNLVNKFAYGASQDRRMFNDEFRYFQALCRTNGKSPDPYPWEDLVQGAKNHQKRYENIYKYAYPAYLESTGKDDTTENRYSFYEAFMVVPKASPDDTHLAMISKMKDNVEKYLRNHGKEDEAKKIGQLNPKDIDTISWFARFRRYCYNMANQIDVNQHGCGISDQSRVDTRNTGMSIVADLLGRPELIVRSVPLKIKDENTTHEGTLMVLGKGIDLQRLKSSPEIRQYRLKNFQTDGIRSMSDLMVIDFICGNIDRHSCNMMYQFDQRSRNPKEHLFTGVQGIDNDCSFGEMVPEANPAQLAARFPYFWNMKVISQSMADKVLRMSGEELKFRLRGQELTEKQLNAAVQRLDLLKAAIREGQQYYTNGEGAVKVRRDKNYFDAAGGHLRTLPDEEFKNLNLTRLCMNSTTDSYYHVLHNFTKMYFPEDFVWDKLTPQAANKDYGLAVTQDELDKVTDQLKRMEEATKPNKTSDEFEDLRKAVGNYQYFCLQHVNTMLSQKQLSMKGNLQNEIAMKAAEYLRHKQNRLWTTSYAQKRIDLANQLRDEYSALFPVTERNARVDLSDPELQMQIKEYNELSEELMTTRSLKDITESERIEVSQAQLNNQNQGLQAAKKSGNGKNLEDQPLMKASLQI